MGEAHGQRAVADGARDPLGRARAHVAGGEDAGADGLEQVRRAARLGQRQTPSCAAAPSPQST
jgi:hypothetical protein